MVCCSDSHVVIRILSIAELQVPFVDPNYRNPKYIFGLYGAWDQSIDKCKCRLRVRTAPYQTRGLGCGSSAARGCGKL